MVKQGPRGCQAVAVAGQHLVGVAIFAQEGHEAAVQRLDFDARVVRQLSQQAEPAAVRLLPRDLAT